MSQMTIEQLRFEKRQMEADLERLIHERVLNFQRRTMTGVRSIDVSAVNVLRICSADPETVGVKVSIRLETGL